MNIPLAEVFISYAHVDETYHRDAISHLAVLERSGRIACWHDRKIAPGSRWAEEIDERIKAADVILALLSPAFIASDYCYGVEMSEAIQRSKIGRSILLPVVVRPLLLSETPFAHLQALPRDARAISIWPHPDEAWTDVTKSVLTAGEQIGSGLYR